MHTMEESTLRIDCHLKNNSSSNSGVQNIKCEPHLTSPTGSLIAAENSNPQQKQIEDANNKINSGIISSDNLHGVRDVSSDIKRKNSNSSVVSASSLHASPTLSSNNANDNSNSSNSAISQIMDAADASSSNGQQHQSQDNKTNSEGKVGNKIYNIDDVNDDKLNMNNAGSGNDDNININASESGNFINSHCISKDNSSSSTPSSSSSIATTKDEAAMQAVLGNLVNVKKEQGSVETPDMSPDSFGSLPSLIGNNTIVPGGGESTAITTTNVSGVNLGRENNTNNNNSKASAVIGGNVATSSISNLLNDDTSNGQQSLNQNNGNFGGNISIMPSNSMDYMQQQNHIFVFSTQLANRGAESVLNGQFPTIIAFHCAQPATKKFLEDFFLKNPMKMAKIQRQNSLNMAISVSSASEQWMSGGMGGGPAMQSKNNQKLNSRNNNGSANMVNTNINNNSVLDEKATSSTTNAGYSDINNPLSGGTSELMSWDQTSIGLGSIASNLNSGQTLKINENSDKNIHSPHNNSGGSSTSIAQQSPSKPIGIIGNTTGAISPNDSLQPSLQGVKVPDENLTPQQRQHREEQLAKIKKMNQFLFPEHGSDLLPDTAALQASNQLGKLTADNIIANNFGSASLAAMLGNSPSSSPGINSAGNQIKGSRMDRASATISRNSLNMNAATDDIGISTIIGGPGDINSIHCGNTNTVSNNIIMNAQQSLACGPGNFLGSMGPNSVHSGNSRGSLLPHDTPTLGLMLQGGPPKEGTNQLDLVSGQSSQIEWSKMQQFYEDHATKNNNKNGLDVMPGLCRSLSTGGGGSYVRSAQSGPNVNSLALNSSSSSVRSQGPPPPYHPKHRSASVPIATQSPNPASPNNPTSNLSLPSPRSASGTSATNLNSPSSESHTLPICATKPPTSNGTSASMSEVLSSTSNQSKTFQQEDSPTGQSSKSLGGSGNSLRNNLNQFNSNPSTPLSNMSPKDLENMSTGIIDAKNPRPSPQRSRTPHLTANNSTESTNVESRFPSPSPGISFSAHLQNQANGAKILNNSNENSPQTSFGRRPDNLPLNPNNSRPASIKQNLHFDPISSLAQMSQQLTSCVSSNAGIGGSNSIGINNSMPGEMVGGQNMEGLLGQSGPMDGGIDHCGNVSGMSPHMLGSSQYGGGNCHMGNSIINPIGTRLHAPRMTPGFGGGGPVGIREGPVGFHGGIPPHRMMGRMGVGFCPFNGSPNIQVKASTPNTIQYMPVRPQTSNTNPRVPPSLEFLQRFANPQMAGSPNMDGPKVISGASGTSDINKIGNTPLNPGMQNSGMNFFPNSNQIGGGGTGSGHVGSGNQLDIGAGMIPGLNDIGGVMNMGNPLSAMNIRGMRPVRQGTIGPCESPVGGMSHRMQGPGSHIISEAGGVNQFGNISHEAMSDSNNMFVNAPGGPNQIYGQQKESQMSGQTLCQNISPGEVRINGPIGNAGIGPNEQIPLMPAQLNSNGLMSGSVSGSVNNGPANYKSYIRSSPNDMKYAQQYHNFQQQLYATSTRSQINQQIVGTPTMGLTGNSINMSTNASPGFFVGK